MLSRITSKGQATIPAPVRKTLLRQRAEATGVAPRLIADSEDIEKIAAHEDDNVPALHGWRAEVFGNDALALRGGRLALALHDGDAVLVNLELDRGRE